MLLVGASRLVMDCGSEEEGIPGNLSPVPRRLCNLEAFAYLLQIQIPDFFLLSSFSPYRFFQSPFPF